MDDKQTSTAFGSEQMRRRSLIALTLMRLGADPAMASSIFLTTATAVASMGLFLSLATMVVR